MSETLKNRPKEAHIGGHRPAYDRMEIDEWFEGFETKMRSFKDSQVRCVEWIQKYTMIDPLDGMKLMQVQAALRTFIEKEVLGE